MYIACNTRPDIMYQVGALSCFMKQANEIHATAAKRVLRYLQGSPCLGIWLGQDNNGSHVSRGMVGAEPIVWTDSDWNAPRSTSGGVILVDGPVRWWSKRQPVPALSSTEAEIIATSEAAREGRAIELQVDEFRAVATHESKDSGPQCYGDNTGANLIARLEGTRKKVKHLTLRHLYACSLENWRYDRVSINENLADMFTKNLEPSCGFSVFRRRAQVF